MAITMGGRHFYEFAPFRVEPEERALLRDGQIVPLPPKAFDVLLVLIQKNGRLVSKDELMKTVWADTFVEEANLSQNIFLLRKALREKANQPHYIVTVPGRGYRFGAEVNEISGGESSVPSQFPTPLPPENQGATLSSLLGWPGRTAGSHDWRHLRCPLFAADSAFAGARIHPASSQDAPFRCCPRISQPLGTPGGSLAVDGSFRDAKYRVGSR